MIAFFPYTSSPLLSLSPWNGHLRILALSGMSGTQLSSHEKQGKMGRMRGDCYFKSAVQSHRKHSVRHKRNMWLRKEEKKSVQGKHQEIIAYWRKF